MAKKPAAKAKPQPLTTGEFRSSVKVSIGDNVTDEAEVNVSCALESTIEGGVGTHTGIMFRIALPDGIVVKDYEGAKQMARAETASILRRMASQVAKG